MSKSESIPKKEYGVLFRDSFNSRLDEIAEEVRRNGYSILDVGLTSEEIDVISKSFDTTYDLYVKEWGASRLERLNELHTIRMPLLYEPSSFLKIALNETLISLVSRLI